MDREPSTTPATIQTWAKGFRVSERSQEFQLVVPSRLEALNADERAMEGIPWGEVLQPLYRLQPALLEREFALVLGEAAHTATMVAAAHSEDKSGRTSIVVVAGTVAIDWIPRELEARFASARSLCCRLASIYAGVLRGARPEIERQLQEDRFLSARTFDLSTEERDPVVGWGAIAREMKRWSGVKGVATKHFLPLGANILYGTRDEAERNRHRSKSLDGYLDVGRGELVPLNSELALWPVAVPSEARAETLVSNPDPLEEIAGRLDQLAEKQAQTHSLVEVLLRMARGFWGLDDDERHRTKRK